MGTITLSVPDELKSRMSKVEWINWSSIAKDAFERILHDSREIERRRDLERLKQIASKSKFTEKDAKEMSEKVKLAMHQNLVDKGLI